MNLTENDRKLIKFSNSSERGTSGQYCIEGGRVMVVWVHIINKKIESQALILDTPLLQGQKYVNLTPEHCKNGILLSMQ